MAEKEIPAGADLTKLPTIGTYKQNAELAEAFKKAMEESPQVLVIQEKPRWISCSERLPEIFEHVLIIYLGFEGEKYITIAYMDDEENACDWCSDWNGDVIDAKVTHWMPLPEPPESEVKHD